MYMYIYIYIYIYIGKRGLNIFQMGGENYPLQTIYRHDSLFKIPYFVLKIYVTNLDLQDILMKVWS